LKSFTVSAPDNVQLNLTEVDDLKNEAESKKKIIFRGQRLHLQKAKNWARMSGPKITGWLNTNRQTDGQRKKAEIRKVKSRVDALIFLM
jgi:hypothetical protein